MSESGGSVIVDDVDTPPKPGNDLDALVAFIEGPYRRKRNEWRELVDEARTLKDRSTMIDLGYECIVFRSELDPWIALANALHDERRGNHLAVGHDAGKSESRRPTGEVLKAQAMLYTAPLKRVASELGDMQDLLSKTLSWCQTQQKALSADEYGDIFESENTPKTRSPSPPYSSEKLRNLQ